jgi:hypothetical protein
MLFGEGMSKVASKAEVLQSLSKQLRRDDLDDKTFIKLLTLYSKLSGWNDEPSPPPAPQQPVIKQPSALDLVLEAERKRRAEGQTT